MQKVVKYVVLVALVLVTGCQILRTTETSPASKQIEPKIEPKIKPKPDLPPLSSESSSKPSDTPIIAQGPGFSLSARDFASFVKGRYLKAKDYTALSHKEKLDLLNEFVDDELIYQKALTKGLQHDKKIAERLRKTFDEYMIRWLYKIEVTDKISLSQEEIDREFKRLSEKDKKRSDSKLRAKRKAFSSKLRQRYKQFMKELQQDAGLTFKEDNFDFVIQRYKEIKEKFKKEKPRFPFIPQIESFQLTKEEAALPVAVYLDNHVLTVADLFTQYLEPIPPARKPLSDRAAVKRLAISALQKPLLLAEARKRGFDKNDNVVKEFNKRRRQYLISTLTSKELNSRRCEKMTDKRLRKFYNDHPERYTRPTKKDPAKKECIPFEEVKSNIEVELLEPIQKECHDEWKAELRKGQAIKLYDKYL